LKAVAKLPKAEVLLALSKNRLPFTSITPLVFW
jgi:hypothetical protein